MKFLHNLLHRQIVRPYSTKDRQINVDFVIEGMKCHKDDKHDVKGLESEAEVPPFACSYNKSLLRGHMLAVADEEGGVCLYNTSRQGSSAKLKGWVAHNNAIFDIAWVCNEPKLITASGDQTAQLWDVQQSTRLAVFKGHSCSLKSVDFQDENLFVFATGARDGNVMIWDMRCNKRDGYYKAVNTIHNCHSTLTSGTPQRRRGRRLSNVLTPDSQQSVTSVKFQDLNTLISSGAVDGNIKVWDLRKNYSTIRSEPVPYYIFPYPETGSRKHGYSSLTLDSNKCRLFANCTNDIIYMYDCVTFHKTPLATFRGHTNTTFYVKSSVSPDDQYLMSGSGDSDGYIWRIDDPLAGSFHLTGHTNEVTSVAWCPEDQAELITCSDDNSLKVWRVNFTEKGSGDFVGLCEKKPNAPLPTEARDDLPCKSLTPSTSPIRSRSNSSASSPVSGSPNPIKCSSPQEFLQNWLQSSERNNPVRCKTNQSPNTNIESSNSNAKPSDVYNENLLSTNKRARDTEIINRNKRFCLEERMESNNVQNYKNSSSTFNEEQELSNKENVNTNMNSKVKTEQSFSSSKEPTLCPKSNEQSERLSSIETHKDDGLRLKQTNQSECKTVVTKQISKKSNWLRDMGVKKRNLNCKVSRKVNKPSSQPSSPLLQEPSSPNTDLGTVVKNMRSIRDYFVPVLSVELSSSTYHK